MTAHQKYLWIICFFFFFVFIFSFDYCLAGNVNKKNIPHISAEHAYGLFQQGKIFLLDVHRIEKKNRGSILGAKYIDPYVLKKKHFNLPKNITIGVY